MSSNSKIKIVEDAKPDLNDISNFSNFSRSDLEKEIARLNSKIAGMQNAITIDMVSGLLKQSAFIERANDEFKRSRRYDKNLTLVVISMLDQNTITEEHGTEAWDHYITSVAQMCESTCRQGSDILGRISSNQFAVLLPESDMSDCDHFKKRLKRMMDSTIVNWREAPLRSTMKLSAGILLDHDTSCKDLFLRTIKQQASPIKQQTT